MALGYSSDDSVVTILGAEAPHSVVFTNDADDNDSPHRLLRALAAVIANPGSNNANLSGGAIAVALNPEHAQVLADAGMSRSDAQAELQRMAVNTRGQIRSFNTGFIAVGNDDDIIPAVRRPADIVLFIAGGTGLYSAVFPSWAAGAHRNTVVHEVVATGAACELPWA